MPKRKKSPVVVLQQHQPGALQIRTEPINAIRGGYRRMFQRGERGFARGIHRGGGGVDRKCFHCNQGSFTP